MLTKTIDVQEAQADFQKLLSSVASGHEIILTQDNTPVARLVPVAPAPTVRVAGLHAGATWISEDFSEALPDDFWMGTA